MRMQVSQMDPEAQGRLMNECPYGWLAGVVALWRFGRKSLSPEKTFGSPRRPSSRGKNGCVPAASHRCGL